VQSPIIPFRPPWRCAVSLPMLAGRGGERGKVVHDRHGNLAPRRRPSAPRHRQRGCRRTGASSWRPTQEPPPPPHSPRALLRLYPAERKLPVAAPRPAPRRRNARRGRRRNLDPRRVACVASRDGRWGRGTRLTRLHATRTGVSEVRGHTPGKACKRSAAHALLPATTPGPRRRGHTPYYPRRLVRCRGILSRYRASRWKVTVWAAKSGRLATYPACHHPSACALA